MRRALQFILTLLLLAAAFSASAANGKVVKVLPHFLDLKGRHSLSPSLYDRDAYQAKLRQNPALCSGMRFDVLWRGRSATNEMATLRVELRGTAKGDLPSKTSLETQVRITGTAEVLTDPSVIAEIWTANPLLRRYLGTPENPDLIIYRILPRRVRAMKEWALDYMEVEVPRG